MTENHENTLYYGDNLEVLRKYIKDESIDLIYLDPPFNSKASYNILFKEPSGEPSQAQITAFEDTWHWTQETERTFEEIQQQAPINVARMMEAFVSFLGRNDMTAYLTMMGIRLVELRRVLRPTGSIYLHCDPTASHYLKALMDAVFGKDRFRNEIVWYYRGGGVSPERYARRHDILLFYSRGERWTFNADPIRTAYSPDTEERLRYVARAFRGDRVYDKYRAHPLGKHPDDVWPMQPVMPSAKERLSYPTQKPLRLLERIIQASSNEGDLILDPFCGCGTTLVAAEKLGRRWTGIDITHLAINLMKWRLEQMFPGIQYRVVGEPVDLAGARALARQNKYQFQWWALSLLGARPYGDQKKGADTGIDGYLSYFQGVEGGREKVGRAIVQVKGGATSVKDIRDLCHVIDREKAALGIFISLNPSTEPMRKEAAAKGFWRSEVWQKDYPKLQILTIQELLSGKRPELPPALPPYKAPGRAKTTLGEQSSF